MPNAWSTAFAKVARVPSAIGHKGMRYVVTHAAIAQLVERFTRNE